MSFYHI